MLFSLGSIKYHRPIMLLLSPKVRVLYRWTPERLNTAGTGDQEKYICLYIYMRSSYDGHSHIYCTVHHYGILIKSLLSHEFVRKQLSHLVVYTCSCAQYYSAGVFWSSNSFWSILRFAVTHTTCAACWLLFYCSGILCRYIYYVQTPNPSITIQLYRCRIFPSDLFI